LSGRGWRAAGVVCRAAGGGIDFPAAVVSELELLGYGIDRVYEHGRMVGVRLLGPEPPDTPAARQRHRRTWPRR
jgi:hypothetical protein